ncbi:MAG TPA: DNA polymerase III subunit [Gemmataceae bacterium]|nr:DNA polymerase III subunit [Gemmataceae bacterium]
MSWQRIRGHDAIVKAFSRAVQRGRLAHAYLFTGPVGVGKRLFAGELAKVLLCERAVPSPGVAAPGRWEACDECPSCLQVTAETHPDFFTAARPPESPNLPIEVMRELCRGFSLKSARGRGKVAILDDADDLDDPITGNAAANCFLKTLEEPPPRSVFILVGSSVDRQLPTIVSRCQLVRFRPLSDGDVDTVLREQGVGDERRANLVRLSDGSPGQALALNDEELWKFRGVLLQTLGTPRFDSVALAKRWRSFVEEAGKESALQRTRAALALKLLVELLDEGLRLSLGKPARITQPAELSNLESLAKRAGPERLMVMLERCLVGDAHVDRRVQLVLVLEALADSLGQKLCS